MSIGDKIKITGEKIAESVSETMDNAKHAWNKGVIDAKEKTAEAKYEADFKADKAKIDAEKKAEVVDRKKDELKHDVNEAKLDVKDKLKDAQHATGL